MINSRRVGIALFLTGLACMQADGPAQAAPHRERANDRPAEPGGWHAKRVAFDIRDKPWADVLAWFAEQAQLPLNSDSKWEPPNGKVSFYNVGKPCAYSLSEIFDMLNEVLMAEHKLVLLRGDKALTLFPADREIPEGQTPFIQRVTLKELPELPRTQIVQLVVTLKGNPEEEAIAWQVARFVDLECATWLGDGQFLFRGNVASLRRIFP